MKQLTFAQLVANSFRRKMRSVEDAVSRGDPGPFELAPEEFEELQRRGYGVLIGRDSSTLSGYKLCIVSKEE